MQGGTADSTGATELRCAEWRNGRPRSLCVCVRFMRMSVRCVLCAVNCVVLVWQFPFCCLIALMGLAECP